MEGVTIAEIIHPVPLRRRHKALTASDNFGEQHRTPIELFTQRLTFHSIEPASTAFPLVQAPEKLCPINVDLDDDRWQPGVSRKVKILR